MGENPNLRQNFYVRDFERDRLTVRLYRGAVIASQLVIVSIVLFPPPIFFRWAFGTVSAIELLLLIIIAIRRAAPRTSDTNTSRR